MTVLVRPVDDRPAPRSRRPPHPVAAVAVVLVVIAVAALVASTARDDDTSSPTGVRGSGRSTTESRETAPFTRIDLAGTNTMVVRVGSPRSVAVTADDNLVDRITTTVRDGSLVVADQGSFTTRAPMRVTVSIPSLEGVTLSGAGTITVERVAGSEFTATLSGTGTLVVSGAVERVTAVLTDSGTVELGDLVARDARARLDGTGTIHVHATSTLDATLTGTGSIVYAGNPTVIAHKSGTGSITRQ